MKKQKCFVTEQDISTLLQRYTATTVLGVLQEVAGQVITDVKIDWNALVKKSTTGITNAREYQMLWRHLAYRHGLLDKLDDGAQPLDDDSDLETELEASPAVSNEASAEAAACVKVLIASGVSSDANMVDGSTVEAPLTINIPNGQTSRSGPENLINGTSMHGTNITVPVAVPTQPQPVTAAEGLDTHGPATTSLPPRRKRKPWSTAEDMELIAAVQKCGEGNWANIVKGDFKGDRTPSQLSQRWAIIRKRKGTMVGNGSQLSEAQLAARRAMSLALNMPMGDKLKAASPIGTVVGSNSGGGPSNSSHTVAADFASGAAKSQHQQDRLSSKPWVAPKKPSPKPTKGPDSMVKAAAVAAGARIATPSGALSLLKAAQSKTALHIVPGGGPAVKSSVPGSTNGLPSNVHFIRTGLVSHSTGPSNASRPGTQQVLGHSLKPASLAIQPTSVDTPSKPNASAEPDDPACPQVAELEVNIKQELLQKNRTAALSIAQRDKLVGDLGASGDNALPPQVQQHRHTASGNLLIEKIEDQTSVLDDELKDHRPEDQDSVNATAPSVQVQKKLIDLPSREIASNDTSDASIAPARTENESAEEGDPIKAPVELIMGENKM